ncbi:MAG: class I SAM-dependent methyltransferase [Candidatus Thermoplasmatota archaeon]
MFKEGPKWYRDKKIAEKYDKTRFSRGGKILDRKEKKIVLNLVNPKDKKILDIATGTGRFAELLSRKGGKVIGLDASKEMLKNRSAEYIQGDAFELPFEDEVFDITISIRFLHLLKKERIPRFIEEVKRVTREKMIFETLHPLSFRVMYQWCLPQDSHMYSNSCIGDIIADLNFVRKIKSYPFFLFPYGVYQLLPIDLAEKINRIDEKLIDSHNWLASTVYWEVFFKS